MYERERERVREKKEIRQVQLTIIAVAMSSFRTHRYKFVL